MLDDPGVKAQSLSSLATQEIAGAIDADDLTIQWDVAVEIGALTGNFPAAGRLGEKQGVIDSLRDVLQRTPTGPERGVHLCYGDYMHRPLRDPRGSRAVR